MMNKKIMLWTKYEQSFTYYCKNVYHRGVFINLSICDKIGKAKQAFCSIYMIWNLRKVKSEGCLGGSVG